MFRQHMKQIPASHLTRASYVRKSPLDREVTCCTAFQGLPGMVQRSITACNNALGGLFGLCKARMDDQSSEIDSRFSSMHNSRILASSHARFSALARLLLEARETPSCKHTEELLAQWWVHVPVTSEQDSAEGIPGMHLNAQQVLNCLQAAR